MANYNTFVVVNFLDDAMSKEVLDIEHRPD